MNKKQLQSLFEDSFQFKRRLDNGHYDFCQIWSVDNTSNGEKSVLKVYDLNLIPSVMLNEEGIVREIAIRKDLKENVIYPSLISDGVREKDGMRLAFFQMKYIAKGIRLSDYLARFGSLIRDRKESDILEIALALATINKVTENGGHYNVCPDNILLTPDRIYLTGTTHCCNSTSGKPMFETVSLPIGYRPKESMLGIFNSRTDVYAFGLVLHQMLTGHFPYDVQHPEAPYSDEGKNEMRQARKEGPKLEVEDGKMKNVLLKALSSDSTQRYANMDEMYKALSEAMDLTILTEEEAMKLFQKEAKEAEGLKIEKKEGNGFAEVAGMENLKKTLTRDFIKIFQNRELAKAYGITPPNIILYGPPGCGKTFIANKLAEESGIAYTYIKPSDLGSVYIHGTQGKIAELFDNAAQKAPCLLCIDEIDALLAKRGDSEHKDSRNDEVAEWLTQLNNCTDRGIYVVGMTNRISAIDEAVMRRGRFDATFYVPLPNQQEREELFHLSLSHCPTDPQIDFGSLAKMTERYSSSDIVSMVKEASRNAFELTLEQQSQTPLPVNQQMLEETLRKSRPSVSLASLKQYEQERERFEKGADQRHMIGFQ